MVTSFTTPLQRRRRKTYQQPDILTHLPVFAFTDAHRQQIASGELILSTVGTVVADIVRRGSVHYIITPNGMEIPTPRSVNLRIQRPAVPVPPRPVYDAAVTPPESDYTSLTLPMRRALEYFAWASWHPKPRYFTLVNLEKRGLIESVTYGTQSHRATAYGCALYREYGRHDKELQ